MPPRQFDPFGDLMRVDQQIAAEQFERQKYDDLIARQQASDAMVMQDRQMQTDAQQMISDQIQNQLNVQMNAGSQQPGFQPQIDMQSLIQESLMQGGGNQALLPQLAQYDKLLSPPSVGGGVTYKNAKRDDGTVGIFAIKPTGETYDTGLTPEVKTSTGSLSPDEAYDRAVQIYEGKLDINTLPKRGTVRQSILDALYQIDPSFDIVEAEANAKFIKDQSNLRSVGLIAGVEPLFDNLIAMGNGLDNTGLPIWNKIKNWSGEATGDPDIVAFNNARDDFVAEAERILMGSGVLSDSKYNRALANLNSAQSPAQMQAAIDQIRKVIVAREEALKEKPYRQQNVLTGGTQGANPVNDLAAAARAELARRKGQ